MYKDKKVTLTIMSCKRIHFLRRVLKAFHLFCSDLSVIDEVIFYDDSSSDSDKLEMEKMVSFYFGDKTIKIFHFYPNSFPDSYRHSRILNDWRNKLEESSSDYDFLLEDDYLFVDFFKITEAIDLLEANEKYGYVNYTQSYKKFPDSIKPVEIGDYWEWYYNPDIELNSNLFIDDVSAIQIVQCPDLWLTYFNWPSFSLRPGIHNVERLLSIGEFLTGYDTSVMREELDFAIRWSKKYKTLCHKRFHVINLGFESSTSSYTLNNSN